MNWKDALAWVQAKDSANYCGHFDLRLPSAGKPQSIVGCTRAPGVR
jgi:hypothetical protein